MKSSNDTDTITEYNAEYLAEYRNFSNILTSVVPKDFRSWHKIVTNIMTVAKQRNATPEQTKEILKVFTQPGNIQKLLAIKAGKLTMKARKLAKPELEQKTKIQSPLSKLSVEQMLEIQKYNPNKVDDKAFRDVMHNIKGYQCLAKAENNQATLQKIINGIMNGKHLNKLFTQYTSGWQNKAPKLKDILDFLTTETNINLTIQNEDGWTPLHHIAHDNNIDPTLMSKILKNNPIEGLHTPDFRGYTALCQLTKNRDALHANKIHKMELLLTHGANKNIDQGQSDRGYTALHYASNAEEVKLLLNSGAKVNCQALNGYTPLIWAIQLGKLEIFKALIDSDRIKLNQADFKGNTPLIHAINEEQLEMVKTLLIAQDGKIKLNKADFEGNTPLLKAIALGNSEIAKLLIDKEGIEFNLANFDRDTPLLRAIALGNSEITKLLIEKIGVDLNKSDVNGCTPLINAIVLGDSKIVKTLIDKDAVDLNKSDLHLATPLIWAIVLGKLEIATLLIEKGADITPKNHAGKDAYDYAIDAGHTNIAAKLLYTIADFFNSNLEVEAKSDNISEQSPVELMANNDDQVQIDGQEQEVGVQAEVQIDITDNTLNVMGGGYITILFNY
jgi:ankyrin repeat protein